LLLDLAIKVSTKVSTKVSMKVEGKEAVRSRALMENGTKGATN